MPCVVYLYIPVFVFFMAVAAQKDDRAGIFYIYIGVGPSALLVSTNRAVREPLGRGASDRIGSTLEPTIVCYHTENKI